MKVHAQFDPQDRRGILDALSALPQIHSAYLRSFPVRRATWRLNQATELGLVRMPSENDLARCGLTNELGAAARHVKLTLTQLMKSPTVEVACVTDDLGEYELCGNFRYLVEQEVVFSAESRGFWASLNDAILDALLPCGNLTRVRTGISDDSALIRGLASMGYEAFANPNAKWLGASRDRLIEADYAVRMSPKSVVYFQRSPHERSFDAVANWSGVEWTSGVGEEQFINALRLHAE